MNLLHEVLHEVFEKVLYSVYYQTRDEKQKFPESVEFVPHSHFFKNIINEVFNELSMNFQ